MTYGEFKAYLYITGFTPAITRYEFWVKGTIRVKISSFNNEIIIYTVRPRDCFNTASAEMAKEYLDGL